MKRDNKKRYNTENRGFIDNQVRINEYYITCLKEQIMCQSHKAPKITPSANRELLSKGVTLETGSQTVHVDVMFGRPGTRTSRPHQNV